MKIRHFIFSIASLLFVSPVYGVDIPENISTVRIVSYANPSQNTMNLLQGSAVIIKGTDDGNGHRLLITARHVVMERSLYVPQNTIFNVSAWDGSVLGRASVISCDNAASDYGYQQQKTELIPEMVLHDACILRMDRVTPSYDSLPGYQLDLITDQDGKTHIGPLMLCEDGRYGNPGWGRGMSGGALINMDDPLNPKIVGILSGVSTFDAQSDNCAYFAPVTRGMWKRIFNNTSFRGIRRLYQPGHWRVEGFRHGEPMGISTAKGIINTQIVNMP